MLAGLAVAAVILLVLAVWAACIIASDTSRRHRARDFDRHADDAIAQSRDRHPANADAYPAAGAVGVPLGWSGLDELQARRIMRTHSGGRP